MAGCRQNYHEDSENGLNKLINEVLALGYAYHSMSIYFDRHDVALQGFSKYFKSRSDKHKELSHQLMSYQTTRGGRVSLSDVAAPRTEWEGCLSAMTSALEMERVLNLSINKLHSVVESHNDHQFGDFLEEQLMDPQVEIIKKQSDHIANLKRVGTGLGEYMFDKETLGED